MGTNIINPEHSDTATMDEQGRPKTSGERLDEIASATQRIVDASTALSDRMQSLEDKVDSLNVWMQIVAKSQASMSALYDREFLRVGQDMDLTKKNVEALYASTPTPSSRPTDTTDHAEPGGEQISELQDRIANLEAALAEEREKRVRLSELVGEKLQSLSATLKARNATSVSLREDLSGLEAAFAAEKTERINDVASVNKMAVKSCDNAEWAMRSCAELQDSMKLLPKQLKNHISEQIEDELLEINEKQEDMSRYTMSLAERIDGLKAPSPAVEKGTIEELRATITSFDTEIERANARIGEVERSVGDGVNDSRLTGLELQIEKANKRHNALAQISAEDWKKKDERLEGVEARLEKLVDGVKTIWKM